MSSRIVARAVAAVSGNEAEVFFAPKSASYSENEIRGNARPHPDPLPQERGKHAPCPGILTSFGVALLLPRDGPVDRHGFGPEPSPQPGLRRRPRGADRLASSRRQRPPDRECPQCKKCPHGAGRRKRCKLLASGGGRPAAWRLVSTQFLCTARSRRLRHWRRDLRSEPGQPRFSSKRLVAKIQTDLQPAAG